MATGLDTERLRLAFETRPDLVTGIQKAADSPARVALFNSIASFVCDRLQGDDEPAVKRRRVQANAAAASNTHTNGGLPGRPATGADGGGVSAAGLATAAAAETPILEIKDISLSMPQRKKLDLCFTQHYLYARAAGTTAPVQGIVYAWTDIEHVFCVPVPDKAQVQHSYVLLPRGQALASLSKTTTTPNGTAGLPEPLVFTVPAAAPKPGSVGGTAAGEAATVADAYNTLLHWALEGRLPSSSQIVRTDAKVFHSMARQAYRPSEKAVHVRAFRGSKDGFLFFLPTGILWGFKKPLLFLPLDRVEAVSYTNVLQRTFNVVVEVDVGGGRTEEVEFGMLDQEDYGSIDEAYVRRHGLQDRSMAERRKAKRELAENAKDGDGDGDEGEAEAEDEAEGGGTETTDGVKQEGTAARPKTEQELQDEEDEMEEDYDPGSDDDSGGSGSSDGSVDEDEDDGDGDEEDEDEDMEDGEEEEEEGFDVVGKAEE
ncbi:negative regulator of DNA transposition protein [Grosmannia clavigera kw1407]|uniref:Negative regulator of DNA transposition protein n=1 Tax=Grosmannia clavigera (strain kw1407 / UAMH 11150) TaxID=655863 RepID=F0X7S7_GROCL|nr:negative regulator of DNA transposition protein [Grosmannia clavigera kw1407]EFX06425.1 negative regulator of DNA transposition protein [Grosmannia clavigera kw1407]